MMRKAIDMREASASPYLLFTREQWSRHRSDMCLPLSAAELHLLGGQIEAVSMREVEDIYLPLSRLLNFYVTATRGLHGAIRNFLGKSEPKTPFIVGVAGSVAVGKSTTSRILKALLSHWPAHPSVAIITTDGFLFPNAKLSAMGLMHRKGFPESYDRKHLLRVLHHLKSGQAAVRVPLYSHQTYDILEGEMAEISRPDIVIVEGLNVLQTDPYRAVCVSDYLDFTLFVDADPALIQSWYVERVLKFKATSFQHKKSFFHFLTEQTQAETSEFAERVWREVNYVNLIENILPSRQRAQLILKKGEDHSVETIRLRKL